MAGIPRPLRHTPDPITNVVFIAKGDAQGKLHGFHIHLHRLARERTWHSAAAMGHGPKPRVFHLDPTPWGKPLHTIDLKPLHLAWVVPFMGAVPVVDTIIDPAMEAPEHRAHMGRKRIAEKVVLRAEPT